MSARKPRREVFAELLLLTDPRGFEVRTDGASIAVDFDRIADLRTWLDLAGLNSPDLLTGGHTGTDDDGRPYRSATAYPTWHGWEIYAHAREYTDAAPLPEPVRDRLAELAGTGG